ncbi:hypothetical protein J2Z31_004116 [Sinorhizobium kostiense]|uniref:Uncharacterized protein n=1 Tax=Sinorhizobium kostiense TaxID=76747 RepID=A0ABS4R3Y0_9HYPH|nr:hypothetical protein [Sinorhizobium kostiense]
MSPWIDLDFKDKDMQRFRCYIDLCASHKARGAVARCLLEGDAPILYCAPGEWVR